MSRPVKWSLKKDGNTVPNMNGKNCERSKMIRIILNITNFSPMLQTVSGEVVVEYVDYRNVSSQVQPVLTCKFSKRPNQLGYRNDAGYDSAVFHALKPQIDTMINSYTRGMTLAPHDFSWVDDSCDKPLELWKQEKVRDYEASDEFQHARSQKPQMGDEV